MGDGMRTYYRNKNNGAIVEEWHLTMAAFKTGQWEEAKEVVRFKMFVPPFSNSAKPTPDEDGEWVRWEDVEGQLAELELFREQVLALHEKRRQFEERLRATEAVVISRNNQLETLNEAIAARTKILLRMVRAVKDLECVKQAFERYKIHERFDTMMEEYLNIGGESE